MQQRVKAALLSLPGTGMSMGECQRELQAPLVLYLVSKSNIEISMCYHFTSFFLGGSIGFLEVYTLTTYIWHDNKSCK